MAASATRSQGNALSGQIEMLDARNNLIFAIQASWRWPTSTIWWWSHRAMPCWSPNAAGRRQELVEKVQARGHRQGSEHLRIYRPWGWYQTMDSGPRFQVKRIVVRPGCRLSLQRHHHRAEHWIVVRGTAEVTIDGTSTMLSENKSTYIPIGSPPAGQPRQDRARADRGADRQLSRRGRHRPLRGRFFATPRRVT